MNESDTRLRFAVEFAYRDLSVLKKKDWKKLRADMEDFARQLDVRGGADGLVSGLDDFTPEQFGELQERFRGLLDSRVEGQERVPADSVTVHFYPMFVRDGVVLIVGGETLDVLVMLLVLELNRRPLGAALKRIVQCPICARVFFRSSKEKYCSPECGDDASRLRRRRYRKSMKGKLTRSAAAKRRYRRKVEEEENWNGET